MKRTTLNESLDFHDMKDHVTPTLIIDEFESTIGNDSDVIVLTFIVDGQLVGEDLVDWLERGYDWIIDSDISPGEVLDRKFYVFAEMNRRTSAPKRIIELLDDLSTLTDIKLDGWTIKLDGEKFPATEEELTKKLPLTPSAYDSKNSEEINEWKDIAGIQRASVKVDDEELKEMQRRARIY